MSVAAALPAGASVPRTGARLLAERMAALGVERLHLYPGGTIMPTLHAWIELGRPYLVARHEQGAGYAALAAARLRRVPQVAMVTSGPGVTNLLGVVADAYYDSTPLVVLAGQVGTADLTGRKGVRQRGFQEVPTPDLVAPIAKACLRPWRPEELAEAFDRAFELARDGRPGPVVIDLPMDVQRREVSAEPAIAPIPAAPPLREPAAAAVALLGQLLAQSERPVLLAGQGVLQAGVGACHALRRLAERLGAPVATSLLGVGAIPGDHPLCLGYVGHTGSGSANRAMQRADLLVALGSRLDVRQTGTRTDDFVPAGRIVRIDVDAAELAASRVRVDLALQADVGRTLEATLATLSGPGATRTAPWLETIARWREELPLDGYPSGAGCHPAGLLRALDRMTRGRRAVVVTGVGHHQQWVARHMTFDAPRRVLLTSGGHGAMGYDLPSAVGAALARPDDLVLCVVGDGSFQINMQELGTIAEYGLPVKIVVVDNQRLAMVSQFQKVAFGSDPSTGDRARFDFAGFARLYGLPASEARCDAEVDGAIEALLAAPGAALLHATVDPACDVVPMLLAGQTPDAMWPWHRP
ncbi:MAG TPA: thiamine pyrophosphate-binding protein [Myxococcota bacterium]|nr:thiamine pyrophosphate-binding protein [Myxococcota bacterium]